MLFRSTPIVGLTANAMPADRAACFEAGMDEFIAKPIDNERLRAVIAKVTAG